MLTTIFFSDSSLSSFSSLLLDVNDATKTPPRLLVPLVRLDDTLDEDDEESTKEEENEGEDIEEQRAKLIIAGVVILNDDKRERERKRARAQK